MNEICKICNKEYKNRQELGKHIGHEHVAILVERYARKLLIQTECRTQADKWIRDIHIYFPSIIEKLSIQDNSIMDSKKQIKIENLVEILQNFKNKVARNTINLEIFRNWLAIFKKIGKVENPLMEGLRCWFLHEAYYKFGSKCPKISKKAFNSGKKVVKNWFLEIYYREFYLTNTNEGICLVCGEPTNYLDLVRGYNKTCSYRCRNKTTHFQKESLKKRDPKLWKYRCGYCGEYFKLYKDFINHIALVHKEKVEAQRKKGNGYCRISGRPTLIRDVEFTNGRASIVFETFDDKFKKYDKFVTQY